MLFSHNPVQIHPWRIDSLAINIIPLIKHIIKDLDPQMRHSDLIHIGEAHTKTHIHRRRILFDHINLVSNISRRFFHR